MEALRFAPRGYKSMRCTIKLGLFLFSLPVFGQAYSTTVTPGTGYSGTVTVTASGGGCTTEPTFSVALASGGLSAVTPTYAGIGCTSAPTLAVAGNGTGGAAAAVMLPSSIAVLSAVPSLSGQAIQLSGSGSYTAWNFACILIVPAGRVPYVATKTYTFPGTSQTTAFLTGTPPGYAAALTSGIISEFQDSVILPGTAAGTLTNAEAEMVASCAAQQTAMNAWNTWSYYGTRYLNGTWTVVTVN